jgi:hypothetical protein
MSEVKLLSPVARQTILAARALEINQDNIYHYFLFLDNLKQYQQKHFAGQAKLLDFFYDLSVYQLIHEKNHSSDSNNPLLELMQDLSKFKDAIPKDQESWLYEPSRNAFIKAIRLAKQIICLIPRDTLDTQKVNFQERISSLSYSVKAATAVVLNPFSLHYQHILQVNVLSMRTIQEGKDALDAHDHPKNNSFAGALEIISGIALLLIGAIMAAGCPLLGILNAALGVNYVMRGAKRLSMVKDAWVFHQPQERRLAEKSAQAGAAFCKLADRPAALFYKIKSAKVVPCPEVELQSHIALAR